MTTGILVIFFLFSAMPSFAWGHRGHTLVAEVAFRYLDENTKANVMRYLDGMTIEEAANWMDAIKSDHSKDYMKPWHYINLAKGATAMPKEDNIVSILDATLKELDHKESLSDEEVKTKILILFHLIGDLHQPLHVGYPDDRGGNDIKLSFYGRPANLHSIWDTEIAENKNLVLADLIKGNTFSDKELAGIREINIPQWTKESRGYLKNAYKISDGKIDMFYVDANADIVKSQLLKAGIRLAAVLEHYFKA